MTSRNKGVKNIGKKRDASKVVDVEGDDVKVVRKSAEELRVDKFSKIYQNAADELCHMTKDQLDTVKNGKPDMTKLKGEVP